MPQIERFARAASNRRMTPNVLKRHNFLIEQQMTPAKRRRVYGRSANVRKVVLWLIGGFVGECPQTLSRECVGIPAARKNCIDAAHFSLMRLSAATWRR